MQLLEVFGESTSAYVILTPGSVVLYILSFNVIADSRPYFIPNFFPLFKRITGFTFAYVKVIGPDMSAKGTVNQIIGFLLSKFRAQRV